MTCYVSSWTLNPAIPYHTVSYHGVHDIVFIAIGFPLVQSCGMNMKHSVCQLR